MFNSTRPPTTTRRNTGATTSVSPSSSTTTSLRALPLPSTASSCRPWGRDFPRPETPGALRGPGHRRRLRRSLRGRGWPSRTKPTRTATTTMLVLMFLNKIHFLHVEKFVFKKFSLSMFFKLRYFVSINNYVLWLTSLNTFL